MFENGQKTDLSELGEFGFRDTGGKTMEGSQRLTGEMTIREGRIVWDLNAIASRAPARNATAGTAPAR